MFLRDSDPMPVTIISDGIVLEDNLKKSGRDHRWLKKTLERHGVRKEEVWLLTVDEDGKEQFYKKEKK